VLDPFFFLAEHTGSFVIQRTAGPRKIRTAGLQYFASPVASALHVLYMLIRISPSFQFSYGPILIQKGTDAFVVLENVYLAVTPKADRLTMTSLGPYFPCQ